MQTQRGPWDYGRCWLEVHHGLEVAEQLIDSATCFLDRQFSKAEARMQTINAAYEYLRELSRT